MPLRDLTQFTDDELAELAAARPEMASLTDAEITELLPHVTDEAVRDSLVKVMWTRAAREASAERTATETPR